MIASDAGGIPEAIVHGVNGFLVQKALLNNLGTAILEVLNMDKSERESIAIAARRRIVECFQDNMEAAQLRPSVGETIDSANQLTKQFLISMHEVGLSSPPGEISLDACSRS